MRLTLLHPDPARGPGLVVTDVEVEQGTSVAAMRPALARLTGHAGWVDARGPLCVDDTPLADDHLAGQLPLVDGCVLRPEPGPPSTAGAALRAPVHVAVTAGPDCGGLLGVPASATVRIGWAPHLVDLPVADPTMGRVEVRSRRGRVRVRTAGRRRWRRWAPGRTITTGATTLELRARGTVPRSGPDDRTSPAVAGWLVPLAGSLALAAAMRQPLLALVGLVGVLATAGPAAVRWLRRRRSPDVGPDELLTDPAALALATLDAATTDAVARHVALPWDSGGSLAVVGPRELALPVARAAVLGALGTRLEPLVAVHSVHTADWAWCAWATTGGPRPSASDECSVLVADHPRDAAAISRWRSSVPAAHRVLLLADTPAGVPAWCRSVVEVGQDSVRLRERGGPDSALPRHAVTADRALLQVRAAAAARATAGTGATHDQLPATASLATHDELPAVSADGVARAWATCRTELRAVLGRGRGGQTVTVDLVADGPHTLVAGTTGAGKSELLTTLVLTLALRHPPDRLALLLVDFKGGTGLGALATLPHVLEHVTDLDAGNAHRVLSGLRAELRRRERLLAEVGARDLLELDPDAPGTPPRLLVVVDELRALTEDLPDAASALARLAAQGRALGMHLVLATQRPAGAVGADLRANITLRIALRVADRADSLDVLDAPDAAQIEDGLPGRAWIRRGTRPLEPVQVARAVMAPPSSPVRLARPWSTSQDDGDRGWSPAGPDEPETLDLTDAWVRAARDAATGAGLAPARHRAPWLPALPTEVEVGDVPEGDGVALALADLPDEQRRVAVRWLPGAGHLLVVGGPGSGRTTTLLTAGQGALRHGWQVHTVGMPTGTVAHLRAVDEHGRLGSTLDLEDARAVARLLELVAAARTEGDRGHVLLIDRLDRALESLGRLARGAGADRLVALCRGGSPGAAVAASADASATTALHAGAFPHRLVLPLLDPALDTLAGVPAVLAGRRTGPGRAVHLHPRGAELCQVARPDAGTSGAAVRAGRPLVVSLPTRVALPADAVARRADDRWWLPVGLGGDDNGVVDVDVRAGLLVAGPAGSGRSSAVAALGTVVARTGHPTFRLVEPSAGPVLPLEGVRDVLLDDLVPGARPRAGGLAPVLLVDDVDDVERSSPAVGELLTELLTTGAYVLLASAGATSAGAAYRGVLPALRRQQRTLVLDAHDPAAAELVGERASWLVDPHHRPPGRGVLVRGRTACVVQVYSTGG